MGFKTIIPGKKMSFHNINLDLFSLIFPSHCNGIVSLCVCVCVLTIRGVCQKSSWLIVKAKLHSYLPHPSHQS